VPKDVVGMPYWAQSEQLPFGETPEKSPGFAAFSDPMAVDLNRSLSLASCSVVASLIQLA